MSIIQAKNKYNMYTQVYTICNHLLVGLKPTFISCTQFAVIKKMADVDFTTMLCEPELVMITARTVLFAYINLGINNIYLTNFMVLMLCLFGYLFKI